MSRHAVEKYTETPMNEKTAIISITDFGLEFAFLKNKPEYLYQVAFDDVDNDVIVDELGKEATEEDRKRVEAKYNMFSEEQAKAVAEFYFSVCDKIGLLVIIRG